MSAQVPYHQPRAVLQQPANALLKAWQLIKNTDRFITPEQVASATQIHHDVAEAYLQDWFKHGVLERTPRYPSYVYQRSGNWHKSFLAQQLNQFT